MTTMTADLADVAESCPGPSGGRRQAARAEAQIRHAVADFAPPSSTRATVADSPSGTGCGPVAGTAGDGHLEALADDASNHGNQGGQPPVTAACGHVPRQPGGQVPAASGQVPSLADGPDETARRAILAAALATLDGNDRIRLLDRVADTHPEVVEAALWWLAGWHADTRERRRVRNNRSGTLRDRRRRAAAADNGG